LNYNVPWVARRIERYLKHRFENERDPEVPFASVEAMVRQLDEVDRTPRWVIVAALGCLLQEGAAAYRVWKRDQVDIDEVRVRFVPRPATPPPPAPAKPPAKKKPRVAKPRAGRPKRAPKRS